MGEVASNESVCQYERQKKRECNSVKDARELLEPTSQHLCGQLGAEGVNNPYRRIAGCQLAIYIYHGMMVMPEGS